MTGAVSTGLSAPRRLSRRMVDVVVACGVLTLTLPILVLVAVAIKLDSRGPLIDRQVRVGRDGDDFELLAFRSVAAGDDSPVTRVGRFLRWSSIDELPQLWNVVRGDMGLVGPPPGLPTQNLAPEDASQSPGRPGITGLWARSGRRSASRQLL
jgi:lipopolysaccharide/colanic/teichoic acid biosynthesis glycosyltransferase